VAVKSTFGQWTVRLRVRPSPASIVVALNKKDRRPIKVERFEELGYVSFPKELRELINSDIKYGNIYDKLIDKFYDWWDNEY